jgi:hypothetical protein
MSRSAISALEQALNLFRKVADRYNEAATSLP